MRTTSPLSLAMERVTLGSCVRVCRHLVEAIVLVLARVYSQAVASSPGHFQFINDASLKNWKWPGDEARQRQGGVVRQCIQAKARRCGQAVHPGKGMEVWSGGTSRQGGVVRWYTQSIGVVRRYIQARRCGQAVHPVKGK